jgi:hypothetical protein
MQDDPISVPDLPRRQIVMKLGAMSTLAGLAPGLLYSTAALAQYPNQSQLERFLAAIDILTPDTMAGVSAFVVPGNDAYSLAQGVATLEPGGKAARNDAFLVYMFNNYLPLPPPLGSTLATALGAPLKNIIIPLRDGSTLNVGEVVTEVFNSVDSVPLALVVALLLNGVAVIVDPTSARGLFLSPFSRLSWREKARVMELLEEPADEVLALLGNLPEPLIKTIIGYVQLVALGLMAFAGFGSYSEWAFINPTTRTLRSRPVGWRLSKYNPNGPVEGWDEFRGYYQGRRSALDA